MNNHGLAILNHKLIEESIKDAHNYMAESLGENHDLYAPSELEKYSFSVMDYIMRISRSFTALKHARVYMLQFRNNKWYREAGIVKGNYINYHYIKYAITVVTIMDVCLILTNYIFRLGNPERLCSMGKVTNNSQVISSNIDKDLNELNKIVEPWREPRNLFVHRGWQIYRENLTMLESYELLYEKGKIELNISSRKIKSIYQSELLKILNEFDEVESTLPGAVNELLNKLLPVYLSWREKL